MHPSPEAGSGVADAFERTVEETANPFWIVFGFAAVVTGAGFVTVVALIVHRAVRSARDPEYRATLEVLQARGMRAHDRSASPLRPAVPSYDPATDPGNPASPMFPGGPGNPI